MRGMPSVTILEMERPPVIPEIAASSTAVITDFECQNDIILELVFGEFQPSGKLPIELPSSMKAVKNQLEDVPYDSVDPLYHFGQRLTFNQKTIESDLLD